MAIKDILVHITDAQDGDGRLATALALASKHEAHVTGLYTLYVPPMPGYVQTQLGEEPDTVFVAGADLADVADAV